MPVLRIEAGDELIEVRPLERVGLEREMLVRPQVVDLERVRPAALADRLAIEEEDVRLDALGAEDAGRQPEQRMDVALL